MDLTCNDRQTLSVSRAYRNLLMKKSLDEYRKLWFEQEFGKEQNEGNLSLSELDSINCRLLQSAARGYLARKAIPKERKLARIHQEIVDTERTYCTRLKELVDDAVIPWKKRLSEEEHMALFCGLEMILELHIDFLEKMERNMYDFGNSVLDFSSFLSVYHSYVSTFEVARQMLVKNKKVISLVEEFKGRQLRIEGYMIMPVSRLPRYYLLLTEMLQNLRVDHHWYWPIKKAAAAVRENSRIMDQQRRIADSESNKKLKFGLFDKPIAFDRLEDRNCVFLSDYSCVWLDNQNKPIRIFLFSDCLLISKQKKLTKKLKVVELIDCGELSKLSGVLGSLGEVNEEKSYITLEKRGFSIKFWFDPPPSSYHVLEFCKNIAVPAMKKKREKCRKKALDACLTIQCAWIRRDGIIGCLSKDIFFLILKRLWITKYDLACWKEEF